MPYKWEHTTDQEILGLVVRQLLVELPNNRPCLPSTKEMNPLTKTFFFHPHISRTFKDGSISRILQDKSLKRSIIIVICHSKTKDWEVPTYKWRSRCANEPCCPKCSRQPNGGFFLLPNCLYFFSIDCRCRHVSSSLSVLREYDWSMK